ncbi:amino acid transporter [Aaosphaeria arxii CBS 175.79]|uniref:Amino acid transporter n=1 Tax=Aaosphaeria arxii CBS 175.79 TaxID=1450172 RepID=A0A6A5XG13_9PLEO|nr:amino acid transporter [Aaosphaeria arxii CBS 175.79]KAF2011870.1 amino acid transporter [Aaosphaeria arxii CBS 175.79]
MKKSAPSPVVSNHSTIGEPDSNAEGHLVPRLNKLTMVGMSFAILNTWICLAGSIGLVMPSGGSVSFVYGFIFCVLAALCLGASMGEMASIWPTAGGQYHFTYALCTEKWRNSVSFWCGWTNIAGWLTLVTTEAFFAAQFISAAAVVGSGGSYVIEAWKTYLIFVAVSTYAMLVNIFGNRILGKYNDCALYWSILGCVVISVVILATSDKNSAEFVFTDFANNTGYSDGVAWILGLLQSALSLIGYDVIMHMTEEMPSPRKDAPIAILLSIIVGGVTGTIFILVMLFSLTDPDRVFSTKTGLAIVELIYQATNNRAATVIMTLMLSVCFVNGTLGSMTSGSRLLYAMARDKGVIFPEFFGRIRKGLDVPVEAIVVTQAFNLLFGLLYLGPTVAFGAYISSCTILLNLSYAIPITVVLLRGRSVLTQHQTADIPFQLGKWGYAINYTAVIFVGVTTVFFCFPAAIPVSVNTMNYVSAVLGIFIIFLTAYWIFFGDRFEGPVSLQLPLRFLSEGLQSNANVL